MAHHHPIRFAFSLPTYSSNGLTSEKYPQSVDENGNNLRSSLEAIHQIDGQNGSLHLPSTSDSNNDTHHTTPRSCIIEIEPLSIDNENNLINTDSIEHVLLNDMDTSIMSASASSALRATQLDAIVEDSNEESSDDLDETMQPMK